MEEALSSEEQMKKIIRDYASIQLGKMRVNRSLYNEEEAEKMKKILNTDDLNEMLKYYNPSSAIRSSVPQIQAIDYSMIEDAMSRAVKKLNLTVTVNNKVLGEIVDEHIRRNLRR